MTDIQGRALVGLVFAIVVIGGIYWSQWTLFLLFFIVGMFCLWEFTNMIEKIPSYLEVQRFKGKGPLLGIGGIVYALIGLAFLGQVPWSIAIAVSLPLFFILFVMELFANSTNPFTRIGLHLIGLIYIIIPCALANGIANVSGSFEPNFIMGVLLMIWCNDSWAYLVGRQIGKTPLFTRVSPKKTWEGSMGGAVFTLIAGGIISYLFPELLIMDWLILALIVVLFGSTGDLIESLLKRSVKVKDSSGLLLYHGGFLDRFDAMIFCLPFVFSFLYLRFHY